MPSLKLYDPALVSFVVGSAEIDGWADGNMISVTNTTDQFTTSVGATGEVVRTKGYDRRATITVRLKQTSDSNDILSAIHNADLLAPNGAGVFPLTIRDRGTGRALYEAAECWVAKAPDVVYAQTDQPREWKLECAALVRADLGS